MRCATSVKAVRTLCLARPSRSAASPVRPSRRRTSADFSGAAPSSGAHAPRPHGKVQDPVQRALRRRRSTARCPRRSPRPTSADVLLREANSTTDNPLVFAEDGERRLRAANFHGEPGPRLALRLHDDRRGGTRLHLRAPHRETSSTPTFSGLPPFPRAARRRWGQRSHDRAQSRRAGGAPSARTRPLSHPRERRFDPHPPPTRRTTSAWGRSPRRKAPADVVRNGGARDRHRAPRRPRRAMEHRRPLRFRPADRGRPTPRSAPASSRSSRTASSRRTFRAMDRTDPRRGTLLAAAEKGGRPASSASAARPPRRPLRHGPLLRAPFVPGASGGAVGLQFDPAKGYCAIWELRARHVDDDALRVRHDDDVPRDRPTRRACRTSSSGDDRELGMGQLSSVSPAMQRRRREASG